MRPPKHNHHLVDFQRSRVCSGMGFPSGPEPEAEHPLSESVSCSAGKVPARTSRTDWGAKVYGFESVFATRDMLIPTSLNRYQSSIDVPTLVIQGDADRIVPITAAGLRTAKLIKGARLLVVKDGPHCIPWTHAEEVNRELLSFLAEKASSSKKNVA
jgi:pimeloyl-ACP methyl ester carboxylesterase